MVRGQYRAGAVNGVPVVGYLEEQGIPPDSTTETFVAIKAHIDTWRWAGVPFYLRTGKRLQEQIADIVIHFEDVPLSIFERVASAGADRLVISLQPRDSITLTILAKTPGETMRLRPVDLRLDMAESVKTPQLDAYERLLTDVIKGNLTLFMRRDEAGCSLALDRPGARGLDTIGPAAEELHRRQLGSRGREFPDWKGRLCLARRNLTYTCAALRTPRR